jgi:2'-5' RNA ligase
MPARTVAPNRNSPSRRASGLEKVHRAVRASKDQSSQPPQRSARSRLRHSYDRLWSDTIGKIEAGKVELDRVLAAREPDQRRGLTLIARPTAEVRRRVAVFLNELRKLEPDQYYYHASEFHLTVLSLFTATEEHRPHFAKTEHYVSAVDLALRQAAPIRIEFEGITASPGALMIQGFLGNDELNDLREILRRQLRARRLAASLDQRYRLETAHMTVARFRAPLRDSERFADALEQARGRSFGAANIRSFSLVKNDWYMSSGATETLKRYRLAGTA